MRAVTIVTDGGANAAALARWLAHGLAGARLIQARGAGDVDRVMGALRKESDRHDWLLAVSGGQAGGADFTAEAALRAVDRWLSSADPIVARAGGPEIIERAVREGAEGSEAVIELARVVQGRGAAASARPRKKGRPPTGHNVFAGAGFDVCIVLLLHPERAWTERALAEAAERSPFAIHRVLVELNRLGYLERRRGATAVKDPIVLRDHLAFSWRERFGGARPARGYLVPHRGRDLATRVRNHAARVRRGAILWAGPSAVEGAARLIGGPLVVYVDGDLDRVFDGLGYRPVERGVADLIVWPVAERGTLFEPRRVAKWLATNRVVTYLDLVAADGARYRQAAETVWREAAA